jgi:malonyl-CoA/methylmalonyl-CoA synthetase
MTFFLFLYVQLRAWAKDQLPSYSLPSLMKVLPELPKNAMGKVNKKELVKLAF